MNSFLEYNNSDYTRKLTQLYYKIKDIISSEHNVSFEKLPLNIVYPMFSLVITKLQNITTFHIIINKIQCRLTIDFKITPKSVKLVAINKESMLNNSVCFLDPDKYLEFCNFFILKILNYILYPDNNIINQNNSSEYLLLDNFYFELSKNYDILPIPFVFNCINLNILKCFIKDFNKNLIFSDLAIVILIDLLYSCFNFLENESNSFNNLSKNEFSFVYESLNLKLLYDNCFFTIDFN